MFDSSLAQPRIIGELKAVLEGIDHNPLLPGEIKSSVQSGLMLIAQHQQKPEKFRAAMDRACEKILAMPAEDLKKLGQPYLEHAALDDVDVRERWRFATTMGGFEQVDDKKAEAFIKANPKAWKVWQESGKFWKAELT
jgi:hypothetical protein